MPVDIHSKDSQLIRQLIPLSTMAVDQFESLCHKITIETAEKNTLLFTKNDIANDLIYLIEGSITLKSDKLKVETIESGSRSSRFALAHQIPRKIDALTNTTVRFLRVKLDDITALANVSNDEETSYMVVDDSEENNDDWLSTLLQSPIFNTLPPSNLQQIMMGLEEVSFEKGALIIKQGEPGDFYYIIKKGKCLLTREPTTTSKGIKLAELQSQDTFGEDSLLSDEPRNVSITALSKMTLLRLHKDKFIPLIKEPTLKFIEHDQINDKLAEGAILLDVRRPDEYKKHHLPKSVNIPFSSLRQQLKILDKSKPVLVICRNGKNSSAAAFILLKQQFNTFVVANGIQQAIDKPGENESQINVEDAIEAITVDVFEDENEPESPINNSIETPAKEATQAKRQNTAKEEIEQLKLTIQNLTEQKKNLEEKYRLLFQQTKKLKSALDAVKTAKHKPD